jgi:hypothetical protein
MPSTIPEASTGWSFFMCQWWIEVTKVSRKADEELGMRNEESGMRNQELGIRN